jgi:hypothetical protein
MGDQARLLIGSLQKAENRISGCQGCIHTLLIFLILGLVVSEDNNRPASFRAGFTPNVVCCIQQCARDAGSTAEVL